MEKQTKVKFWGGLRTIGGTVVTLEYNNARVLFDFGVTYSPATRVLDGQIKERPSALVRDYLKLKMLPIIDGIYSSRELIYNKGILGAEEDDRQTAVIISHLHLDHMAAMGLIDPSIPVYLTRDSHRLYTALDTVGEGVPGKRDYQICDYDQEFRVGDIRITPIELDHDIMGACGFHIATPDGSFIYTGDVRLHGKYPEKTEEFIEKSKKLGKDILIMEGVTLRSLEEMPDEEIYAHKAYPQDLLTEEDIYEEAQLKLRDTRGIGIFNIYHRNIERIGGMIQAAQEAGRKAVLEPETAYLALKLSDQSDFLVYSSEEMKLEIEKNTMSKWKKEVITQLEVVGSEQLNKNPQQYFVQNSYKNILELFDLNLEGGLYIHSNGMPLGDYDPAYGNLKKIMELLNLERIEIGTSGHAIPTHLKFIVDEIDPKVLVPLHSFNPERLKPKNGIQLLPKYDVTYVLRDGNLVEI